MKALAAGRERIPVHRIPAVSIGNATLVYISAHPPSLHVHARVLTFTFPPPWAGGKRRRMKIANSRDGSTTRSQAKEEGQTKSNNNSRALNRYWKDNKESRKRDHQFELEGFTENKFKLMISVRFAFFGVAFPKSISNLISVKRVQIRKVPFQTFPLEIRGE